MSWFGGWVCRWLGGWVGKVGPIGPVRTAGPPIYLAFAALEVSAIAPSEVTVQVTAAEVSMEDTP